MEEFTFTCQGLELDGYVMKPAGFDPEKGNLQQHIFAQLRYELLSCKSAYRLCGMTEAPKDFHKRNIVSLDAIFEDNDLYQQALAA